MYLDFYCNCCSINTAKKRSHSFQVFCPPKSACTSKKGVWKRPQQTREYATRPWKKSRFRIFHERQARVAINLPGRLRHKSRYCFFWAVGENEHVMPSDGNSPFLRFFLANHDTLPTFFTSAVSSWLTTTLYPPAEVLVSGESYTALFYFSADDFDHVWSVSGITRLQAPPLRWPEAGVGAHDTRSLNSARPELDKKKGENAPDIFRRSTYSIYSTSSNKGSRDAAHFSFDIMGRD